MRDDSMDAAETRLNRLLNLILETAVDVLAFDAATVTAQNSGQSMATIAATDQRLVALDDAQYESREGPCLTALAGGEPIYLEDAGQDDERWRHFSRTAAGLGVHSTLSVHVPTDAEDVAASLNFYAKRRLELGTQQMTTASSFAQQLAAAIESVEAYRSTAKLARELGEAMRSRAVIEQAKGILMAEQHIGADEAFDQLAKLSQQANVKLRGVAARLVAERSAAHAAG